MATNGLKRTRAPSDPASELSTKGTPVEGSSKDLEAGNVDVLHGSDNDNDTSEWTAVTGPAKKKPKKLKAKKLEMAVPLFQFDPAGFKNRSVQVTDIRDLALNILARASHPKWLRISNKAAIRGVVMLLVQGIEPETLGLTEEASSTLPQNLNPVADTVKKSKLPIFQQLFSHYCPTKAPGDQRKLHSVAQALLNAPLSAADKTKREAERAKLAASASGSTDPSLYLLPTEDFAEQGYTLPTYSFTIGSRQAGGKAGKKPERQLEPRPYEDWLREDGWIETPQVEDGAEGVPLLKIVGIDCEMCVTTVGSEVCRVSVVNEEGKLLYNSLVKPKNKIVNYATVYSGMTEELLEPVTTTLEDVQRQLTTIINYDTVLVGHSLNCDLDVLKLAHPWIVDTSVIYHHTRGPPFKASLKWLASKWLQKEIQKPRKAGEVETVGHDSEEDARAAVELLRMKMAKGPSFGEFSTDQESIFERLSQADPKRTSSIVDHGNPGQWHGSKATKAVSCKSDKEVVKGITETVEDHDFVFGRLIELSHTLEWSQPSRAVQGNIAAQKQQALLGAEPAAAEAQTNVTAQAQQNVPSVDHEVSYRQLNEHITQIYESLPSHTAFIILSGHGDPRAFSALTAKKNRFDQLYKTTPLSAMKEEDKWMQTDERALLSAIYRVREGMTFLAIKRQ